MTDKQNAILKALNDQGYEVLYCKGLWHIRRLGAFTGAKAYTLAGRPEYAKRKQQKRIMPWGEYAWIAGMNGRLKG
jgi:hypothetical protein